MQLNPKSIGSFKTLHALLRLKMQNRMPDTIHVAVEWFVLRCQSPKGNVVLCILLEKPT